MNNFFANFSFENIINTIKDSFKKFPLSVISIFIFSGIMEYLVLKNRYIHDWYEDILSKRALSIAMFYFLSIWIYLYTNRQKFFEIKTCILQGIAILFSVFFYFSFSESLFYNFYFENLIYIFISFIWAISLIFISSYLHKIKEENFNNNYYSFFNWIYSKIFTSIFVWIAMMIMWFVAIWAIFSLFDLKQIFSEWKVFWTWAVFSISFFSPYYFLNQINQDLTNFWEKIKENKFYNFVNNYLSIPFIIIYFVILYSYTIKVLINFNSWPEGIISWMIIFFSLFWYLIYIFSYIFEEKNLLVRIFRKYFPIAVLLQTPMLFYAIYLRINQYDFTINRYLVFVFWIYLLSVSLYFIFSKKKYLIAIPSILTIFIIFISVWPWWVYKFPEQRQVSLLKNSLEKAQILVNWDLVLPKNSNDIDKNLTSDINSKISYLCSYHWCYSMNSFFWKLIKEIEVEHKAEWDKNWAMETIDSSSYYNRDTTYRWISSWELQSKILDKLKINPYNSVYQDEYLNFNIKYNSNIDDLFDVKNYDYLLKLDNTYTRSSLFISQIDLNKAKITIYKNNDWYEDFDIKSDLDPLYLQYKENSNTDIEKSFIIEKKWKKFDIKYILNNFSIKNPEYNLDVWNIYMNWYLLIKEKK